MSEWRLQTGHVTSQVILALTFRLQGVLLTSRGQHPEAFLHLQKPKRT